MTTDTGIERALLDACDALQADAIEHTIRLTRHRSVLGAEHACLDEAESLFAEAGFTPSRIPIDAAALSSHPGWSPPILPYAGREPVVAHRSPPRERRGRSLLLLGHLDVVPEGAADLWTSPPFDPVIRDGRLYGRGAADMKAGLVAAVTALRAFARAGLEPAAEVTLAGVIEEECTGNGALAVMQALPPPDGVLIPEPGGEQAALYVGEVGVVWATLTVTGRPAHVSDAGAGVSAIVAAYTIAQAVCALEHSANAHAHPVFAGHPRPVTATIGTFEGGEWRSSVPTRARVGLRLGVMPGRPARSVAAEIERVVAEAAAALPGIAANVGYGGFIADGCLFPPEQPLSQAVVAAHRRATGRDLRHHAATGLTDARHWALYQGTPITCYGTDCRNIHGVDESVGLESVREATRAIALFVADWCGVSAAA